MQYYLEEDDTCQQQSSAAIVIFFIPIEIISMQSIVCGQLKVVKVKVATLASLVLFRGYYYVRSIKKPRFEEISVIEVCSSIYATLICNVSVVVLM